jgi:hypothetical protein
MTVPFASKSRLTLTPANFKWRMGKSLTETPVPADTLVHLALQYPPPQLMHYISMQRRYGHEDELDERLNSVGTTHVTLS